MKNDPLIFETCPRCNMGFGICDSFRSDVKRYRIPVSCPRGDVFYYEGTKPKPSSNIKKEVKNADKKTDENAETKIQVHVQKKKFIFKSGSEKGLHRKRFTFGKKI